MFHLIKLLPNNCFEVLAEPDQALPDVGVSVCIHLISRFRLHNCTVLAHIGHNKVIVQQTQDEPTVWHADQIYHVGEEGDVWSDLTESGLKYMTTSRDHKIQQLCQAMVEELVRAEQKHPKWTSDAVHAAGILAEESGEAMQAAVDFNATGDKQHIPLLITETIQTGAMCLRLLLNADKFRKPIDAQAVLNILESNEIDEADKLFEIAALIKE